MSVGMKVALWRMIAAAEDEGAKTRVPTLVKLAKTKRANKVKRDNLKERKCGTCRVICIRCRSPCELGSNRFGAIGCIVDAMHGVWGLRMVETIWPKSRQRAACRNRGVRWVRLYFSCIRRMKTLHLRERTLHALNHRSR